MKPKRMRLWVFVVAAVCCVLAALYMISSSLVHRIAPRPDRTRESRNGKAASFTIAPPNKKDKTAMVIMREERGQLVVDGENYRLVFQKERGVVDLSLSDAKGHVPVNLQLPGNARPDLPPDKLPGCGFYFGSAPHLTYQVKPHIDARQKGDEVIISEGFDFGTNPSFYLVVNYRCTFDAVYIATQYFVSPGAPLKDVWPIWRLPPELVGSLFRAGPSFISSDRFFSHCQFRGAKDELCAGPITAANGPTYGMACSVPGFLQGNLMRGLLSTDLPYFSLFCDRLGTGMTCVYLDYASVWAPGTNFIPPFGHFLQLLGGDRAAVHTGLVRGYLNQPHRMAILFGKEKGPALEKRVRQVLGAQVRKSVAIAKPKDFRMKLTRRIPDAPDSKEYVAYGVHTGLTGWGWWIPWFETCLPRQLSPYLELFSKYPDAYYNMEISPDSFRTALKEKKGLKYLEQIRQMVSAGKAEMVGATFGQPFNPLVSGECNVRHLQMGVRYTEKVTGKKVISYYTDEPGITAQLPQILKSMGFRYAVLRGVTGRFGRYPIVEKESFWWRGLDGTVIEATGTTQHSPGGEFGLNLTVIYDRLRRLARKGVKRHLATAMWDLREPAPQFPASRIEMVLASPQVEFTTISGYFEKTGRPRDKDTVSFHPDSFITWDYWGSMRSEPVHTAERRAENNIHVAERLMALTGVLGKPAANNLLEDAWANLLVSQHHDIRCGVDWTTEKGVQAARKADSIASRIIKRGLGALKRLVGTRSKGESILVFNPLPWPRRALIETDPPIARKRGKAVVCVELPAFGWRAFDPAAEVSKDSADLRVSANGRCIENEFYRVRVNQAGLITSIYDKELGRQMLRKPSNDLTGYRADKKAWVSSRKSKGTITILDQRPAAIAVLVKGRLGDIPYSTEIRLISGIRRIEITTSLDYGKGVVFGKDKKYPFEDTWNVTGEKFTASMPYTRFKLRAGFHPDLVSPRCYRELSFGATQCKPLKDWTQSGMPYYADTIHGVSWAEMSDGKYGLAILNKGTMGYHRTEDSLSLILGYGRGYDDGGDDNSGRNCPLKGKCTVEYAIVTHRGTYRNENLVRASQEYNLPTPAVPIRGSAEDMPSDTCSLFRMEGAANAVVSAILVEDKHLIIRVAETAGRSGKVKLRFFVPVRKAQLIELDGRVLSDVPVKKEVVEVGLKKWGIRTLRIKVDAPAGNK